MVVIAVASAKGGSARTTTCVRLAKALTAMQIPTGIVDLTPYPSAHFLLTEKDTVPVIAGRAARTATAARSIVKPYEERCSCLLLDTTRLDDPNLNCWLAMVSHFMVTMKVDKNSVRAMPSVWDSFDAWKGINPGLNFMGFLPVCVEASQEKVLGALRQRVPEHILPVGIPWNEAERLGPELVVPSSEWEGLARHVATKAGLKRVAPEAPKSSEWGLVSRVWRLAASVIGPKVSVATGKG